MAEAQKPQNGQENQYAIMGTPWLLFPFERAFAMQGMDKFLLNMAMNPILPALCCKNGIVQNPYGPFPRCAR